MREEILALLGLGLGGTLCELLLPRESTEGMRKLFRFLLSLCVLLLLLTPFLRFVRQGDALFSGEISFEKGELEDYEQIFADTLQAQSTKDLEEGLYSLLQSEYGIDEEDCSITVALGADGALQRVSVFLSGKAILQDPIKIERALQERLKCTVEVR